VGFSLPESRPSQSLPAPAPSTPVKAARSQSRSNVRLARK
jgi:hypothetical protein